MAKLIVTFGKVVSSSSHGKLIVMFKFVSSIVMAKLIVMFCKFVSSASSSSWLNSLLC